MPYPLDKFGRDYDKLLQTQKSELEQWRRVLRGAPYAALALHCRLANAPLSEYDKGEVDALKGYKAGGLHVCPVGAELHHLVMEWGTVQQKISFLNPVSELRNRVLVQLDMNKETLKKISELMNAMLTLAGALTAAVAKAPAAEKEETADEPEASEVTVKTLKAKAKTADPAKLKKLLKKLGIDSIAEADADDFESIDSQLDDIQAEGGDGDGDGKGDGDGDGDGGDGDEITIETLRALAKKAIKAGKSSAFKKALEKHGADSLTELDEKHYADIKSKLEAFIGEE